MNLAYVSYGSARDVFDGGARFVTGMALIAHLRGDFRFFGATRETARFVNGPSKWLLHVNMLAEGHGSQRDGRVHVIGSGDDDGLDVFLLLEHLAIVFVALGFGQVGLELHHVRKLRLGLLAIELRYGLPRR